MPRREHDRFCSASCRVSWAEENTGGQPVELAALEWAIAAMREATGQLCAARAWDRACAGDVVGNAVWWVTIVDSTLVRYHPGAYDTVLACHGPAGRRRIEDTLAGLRFVRNQSHIIDPAVFLRPPAGPGTGGLTTWTWKPSPGPALALLPPRCRAWEQQRHQAYQAQLAGHPLGQAFRRVTVFLQQAAAPALAARA